jgi:putative Mg2+ transporter-C (MgtC) family protein
MGDIWKEVFAGLDDTAHFVRVLVRLIVAVILGGLLGWERQHEGKAAGLRTHMLVALGAALFVLVPVEQHMATADVSRVIQGIAAGIGFLGAGCILKLSDMHRVQGLTTAANIWFTAAVGVACGLGWLWPAILSVALALIILVGVQQIEYWLKEKTPPPG